LQRELHRNAFAVFIIPLRPKQLKQTYRVGADCSGVYIVTVIAGATYHSLSLSLSLSVCPQTGGPQRCPFRISIKCRKSRLVCDRRSSSFTSRRLNDVYIYISYTYQTDIYLYGFIVLYMLFR